MNKKLAFALGLVSGTLIAIAIPTILDKITNKELLDDFDPEECVGCEGPVWINHKPMCGNYIDAPRCNNPKYIN